jgi:hypothetical protein
MGKQLTVAGADYDRTQALIDGRIKPDGFELKWLNLSYPETWTRMLNDYEFDVSELSFASYIIARTTGKPLIAIPVFPLRVFRYSYILIHTGSNIRAPKDLEGKKVGIAEFHKLPPSGPGGFSSMSADRFDQDRLVDLESKGQNGDRSAAQLPYSNPARRKPTRSDAD